MQNGEDTVATRLRALRQRRGWSQSQLAAHSEISNSTVSRIESGDILSPGVEILRRLSGALRVDLSDLTGERPMPRRQPQVLEGAVGLPVYKRRVHAGGETYWDDTPDTVWVPNSFRARYPRAIVAIVDGDCMSPHIDQGEKILFDPDQKPVNGQMVVVTTEDGQTLLKWYRLDEEGEPFLRSADGQEIRPNGAIIEGGVHEAWLLFTLGTGVRLGESRALLWEDVDLKAQTAVIRSSADNQDGTIGPTKTGRIRTIDIPEEVIPQLVIHRARKPPGERYVFGHAGRPYNSNAPRRWLRLVCASAGVRPLSPHSLRHTYASLTLDAGVPVQDVARQLGHTVSTCQRVYSHFIGDDLRRAAKAIGKALRHRFSGPKRLPRAKNGTGEAP